MALGSMKMKNLIVLLVLAVSVSFATPTEDKYKNISDFTDKIVKAMVSGSCDVKVSQYQRQSPTKLKAEKLLALGTVATNKLNKGTISPTVSAVAYK